VSGGLLYFCLRRLAIGIPFLIVIVAITFLLVHAAPGDPAVILAGDAPAPEFLERIRAEYGLDLPLHQQLFTYLWRALHFDFGTSIYFRKPVLEVVAERIPNTLLLTGAAMGLASVLGILSGVWAARYRGTTVDTAVSGVSLLGFSIPTFWLGQLLVLLFAVTLNLLPPGGMIASRARYVGLDHIADVAQHLILPAVTLAAFELCLIARLTRTAMIQALDRDYILVAEAKGASASRVLWRHAFPNAVLTSITIIGLEFGALLAGAVVTETIFGWPGLGRLFYEAVFRRDFPLLNGCFIFASAAVILVNLLTDVLYALVDPRVYRT
jgi:peptide/nickel transport system permease protein